MREHEYTVEYMKDRKLHKGSLLSKEKAERRFEALKRLDASTGVVSVSWYRVYSGGSRRLVEAWHASQNAIIAGKTPKKPVVLKDVQEALRRVFTSSAGSRDNARTMCFAILERSGGVCKTLDLRTKDYAKVIKACDDYLVSYDERERVREYALSRDWLRAKRVSMFDPPPKVIQKVVEPKFEAPIPPPRQYIQKDVSVALAELMRVANRRGTPMVGIQLVKGLLKQHGAILVANLLPADYGVVVKAATEMALELQGPPSDLSRGEFTLNAAKAKVEFSKVNDVYGLASGGFIPPRDLGIVAERNRAAEALRANRTQDRLRDPSASVTDTSGWPSAVKPTTNEGVTADQIRKLVNPTSAGAEQLVSAIKSSIDRRKLAPLPKPIFALHFRLTALAHVLGSQPSLVKLAKEARATNSMNEFDAAAHFAGRHVAGILVSSALHQISRQVRQDSGARTRVSGGLEQVSRLLGEIREQLAAPGYRDQNRLKAAALAREALTVWDTTMAVLPWSNIDSQLRPMPTWMNR
jgi:hypothetical protein